MAEFPLWLPKLIPVDGNWGQVVETLYAFFRRDFISSRPLLGSNPVGLLPCNSPYSDGKHGRFWHMIQEMPEELRQVRDRNEEMRTPDFRRCERIRWPRAIIENSSDSIVCYWETRKKRKIRSYLLIEAEEEPYLVVLIKKNDYFLLVTAYLVTFAHTLRKLKHERLEFERQTPPPSSS